MATNENLPPNVVKRLARELKNLDESPQEGIKVIINDDDFSMIFADIEGPPGTPYENGLFRMKLVLSPDFPHTPPKGYFLTKIFHPNISSNGDICVNTLKKDWNPNLGLRHVLAVIRCLLIEPYPESALNEQAGKILLENYDEYARLARLYTGIHALKPKSKLNKEPSSISESAKALNINNLKSSSTPKVPLTPNAILFGHTTTELLENDGQDENTNAMPKKATLSQVGVATIQKKGVGVVNTKVQGDKRKMDARKKSLRRL